MTTIARTNAVPVREALAASRTQLADAERKRGLAFAVLAQTARDIAASRPSDHRLASALAALDHHTAERDHWREAVDELVREAAIATEAADPSAPTSETRARVEALIAARVVGLPVAEVDTDSPRRWRIVRPDTPYRREPIPHYASDLAACASAEAHVDGLAFVRVLIDDVLALDRRAGRREVALAVHRATPFERALAVLGAAGVNPADDPCEVRADA
jgi:hypothetical protein